MELLLKLERMIQGWLKDAPHLPTNARKWLGDNIWWIVAIAAVLCAVSVLGLIVALFSNLTTLSSPFVAYYASATFVAWATVKTAVSLIFTAIGCALLSMAVTPLREKQKKGWVLVFASLLVGAIAVIIGAIITLNPFGFLTDIIFGALWLGVSAYFIFEIHGQFAHVERSKGVKRSKA